MKRPLRVLHILQYMYGYGAERQLAQLLTRVKSEDLEVGVLTVYAQSSEGREAFDFPVSSAGRRTRRDYAFISHLLEGVRSFRPDIAHTHTLSGKYWGRFAALANGVRAIVHTEHNPCDTQQSLAQSLASSVLNQHTSRVVTFFPEQGEFLARREALAAHKVAIIPNGLEFQDGGALGREGARALLGVRERDYVMMAVGRLTYQKNPELAIRTVAALEAKHGLRAILCFAGTGSLEPELHALAQALDVADRVRFLGYRSDVPALLRGADALLMTSRYEGMPLTLIEALDAGVPIVTTPWLGSSTMLGAGAYGRIVSDAVPDDLARAIVAARSERSTTQTMVEDGRTYARSQYSLDRMVRAHRSLYETLASSGVSAA